MARFTKLLFVEYVLLALALVSAKHAGENDNTVASLMALKVAVTNDPFSALENWNHTSHHVCNWTGILCKRLHVVGIDLRNLSLEGFIPPQLGNLSSLRFLDLSHNSLTAHIPPALGKLGLLKGLYLSKNNLMGNIPRELGNLGNLQILSSYGNNHSGSIPGELGNCSLLQKIDLAQNNLSGRLPREMGMLSRLVLISLDNNYLAGPIPPSLFNCTELRNLSLNFNSFLGPIPSDIGARLPNLDWLLLAGNNVSGAIPKSLGNCSRLSHVELGFNKLGGIIPQELGKLPRLVVLNMHSNRFVSGTTSGPIPILEALSNCPKLQKLDLSRSRLTGILPASIGKLSDTLIFLNLEMNNISGSIPKEIGNLYHLIELYMDKNSLVGTIPSEIGNLLNLEAIDLSHNKLQGRIPTDFQFLHEGLQYLNLEDNMLSGLIPESIGKLNNLRDLNLGSNRLYGRIPPEIGQCTVLENLALCCNNLSGTIPSEVANLRNLNSFLDLSVNALTGPVPPEIGGMQMVQAIDLSANQLSGSIPAQITGSVGVEYLNLSCNRLVDVLPWAIGQKLSILNSLDLSHNNLTGPVPASISKLEMLQLLNLSYNNFTGKIPCSGALKNMNRASFVGNPGLCGNCSGLASCSTAKHQSSTKKKRKTIFIAAFVGVFAAFCLTGLAFWIIYAGSPKKESRPLSPSASLKTAGDLKISMEELKRATGNYSPSNLIGAGSYGSVYRGVLSSGETVAVKVFTASNSERAERSFLRECKTLGKVRHRNLVKIITSCSTSEFKALVLPFMANGSLDRHLHGQELSLQRRLSMLYDVAHGLSYLHHDCSPQIVHCDLKPQNILLDGEMTCHVADFGIARLFSPTDDARTTTSALKGTVGYIPPEYGIAGTISTKGDVYSYGILMLEVLTQRRPTDEMFGNGLSLSGWVSTAFPSVLQSCIEAIPFEDIHGRDEEEQAALKYSTLEGLLKLGLWGTSEAPENRPSMRQIESALGKMTEAIHHNHNHPYVS